jgi:hypothetical protein
MSQFGATSYGIFCWSLSAKQRGERTDDIRNDGDLQTAGATTGAGQKIQAIQTIQTIQTASVPTIAAYTDRNPFVRRYRFVIRCDAK